MTTMTPTKPAVATSEPVVALKRRTLDSILIGVGAVLAAALFVAGALLSWGSSFAADYVDDELSSQNITFPPAAALEEEGRDDLAKWGEEFVNTGPEAEAYASFINGHLATNGEGTAWEGKTYAELGPIQRAAKADLDAAMENGISDSEIADLQATVDAVTADRERLFKGETLRGLLLTAYAWDTVGSIAGYAAIGAFVAGVAMLVLVALGLRHNRKPVHS